VLTKKRGYLLIHVRKITSSISGEQEKSNGRKMAGCLCVPSDSSHVIALSLEEERLRKEA